MESRDRERRLLEREVEKKETDKKTSPGDTLHNPNNNNASAITVSKRLKERRELMMLIFGERINLIIVLSPGSPLN